MYSRRRFIGAIGSPAAAGALAAGLGPHAFDRLEELAATVHAAPQEAATDELFWREIQQAFTVDRSLINLNNGGVSLSPFTLHASLQPDYSCAFGTVQIRGIDSGELASHLWRSEHIIVTPIKHPEFEGIRVSPSVYTTLDELDRFSEAMERVADNGIPTD